MLKKLPTGKRQLWNSSPLSWSHGNWLLCHKVSWTSALWILTITGPTEDRQGKWLQSQAPELKTNVRVASGWTEIRHWKGSRSEDTSSWRLRLAFPAAPLNRNISSLIIHFLKIPGNGSALIQCYEVLFTAIACCRPTEHNAEVGYSLTS